MPKFIVILHDAQDGSQAGRAELKLQLIEHLHLSEKTVDGIFESLPVIISSDLDQKTAERYAETLEGLGAVAEVIEQAAPVEAPPVTKPIEPAPLPEAGADHNLEIDDLERMLEDALAASEEPSPVDAASTLAALNENADQELNAADWHLGDLTVESEEQVAVGTSGPIFALEEERKVDERRPSILDDLITFESGSAEPERTPIPESVLPEHQLESAPRASEEAIASTAGQFGDSGRNPAFARPVQVDSPEPIVPPPVTYSGSRPGVVQRTKHLFGASTALLFAVVLVFGSAALYAITGQEGQRMTISFDIGALLREQAAIFGGDEQVEVHMPVVTGTWQGSLSESARKADARVTALDEELSLASFHATADQPPPLTQAEFVAGKAPPVWLRRVDVENLRPQMGPDQLRPATDHAFLLSGIGKAYLEDAKGSGRVSVRVRVLLEGAPDKKDALVARWMVTRFSEPASFDEPEQLSRINAGDFSVLFHGALTLEREAAPNSASGAPRPESNPAK
ncbi:MAG: hypothetical protein U0136_02835 [Bdellovibrionota bacterium]